MEEIIEEKKKSKKGGVVALVIILILVILGLVGYICYDKGLILNKKIESTENGTTKVEKEETKTLDVYSDLVQDSFDRLTSWIARCDDPKTIYFKSSKVVASDIKNEYAFALADKNFYDRKTTIEASEYEKLVADYFGKDYKFEHTNYTGEMCTPHAYKKETNQYVLQETACGCTTGPNMQILTRIASAELKGDQLTLTIKALFPGTAASEVNSKGYTKYFSDADHKNAIEDIEYTSNGYSQEPSEYYPVESDSTYAKGGTFKFVMKKNANDKYSFVSSEPVK